MNPKLILIIIILSMLLATGCSKIAKDMGLNLPADDETKKEIIRLSRVVIDPQNSQVKIGEKIQFSAKVYYGTTEATISSISLTWETNSKIGTINSAGLFTALAEGICEARATFENLTGVATISVTIPPDITPPSPPKNFSGIADHGSIYLSWDKNSEEDFKLYQIYRQEDPASPLTKIATSTAISYTDFDLTNSTTYIYKLKAVDSGGNESGFSDELSLTPTDRIAPQTPRGLQATSGYAYVDLSWKANNEEDLSGYKLYKMAFQKGIYNELTTLGKITEYKDTDVTNGETYLYTITAIDTASNESVQAPPVFATPQDTTPPSPPQELTATAGITFVDLFWNENGEDDLSGYNLYFSYTTNGSFYKTNTELITSTSYRHSSLMEGTSYYYKISAVDTNSNESLFSKIIDITTGISPTEDREAPQTPTNFHAEAGDYMVALSWNINQEADLKYYKIERRSETGSLRLMYPETNNYIDEDVENDVTYYYKLAAIDTNSNQSLYTEEIEARPVSSINNEEVIRSQIALFASGMREEDISKISEVISENFGTRSKVMGQVLTTNKEQYLHSLETSTFDTIDIFSLSLEAEEISISGKSATVSSIMNYSSRGTKQQWSYFDMSKWFAANRTRLSLYFAREGSTWRIVKIEIDKIVGIVTRPPLTYQDHNMECQVMYMVFGNDGMPVGDGSITAEATDPDGNLLDFEGSLWGVLAKYNADPGDYEMNITVKTDKEEYNFVYKYTVFEKATSRTSSLLNVTKGNSRERFLIEPLFRVLVPYNKTIIK